MYIHTRIDTCVHIHIYTCSTRGVVLYVIRKIREILVLRTPSQQIATAPHVIIAIAMRLVGRGDIRSRLESQTV